MITMVIQELPKSMCRNVGFEPKFRHAPSAAAKGTGGKREIPEEIARWAGHNGPALLDWKF
jgi:hypothetical protein